MSTPVSTPVSTRMAAMSTDEHAMSTAYDAVVVGAGPNGLVAANRLVDAGWSVLVLEAQPDVGGAVHSADDVHPGFVHDTFSSFYPLAAASAAIRSFALEEHGLRLAARAGGPRPPARRRQLGAAAPRPRGDRTPARDAAPRRRRRVARPLREWDVIGDQLVAGLLTPFPPVRAALGGLRPAAEGRRHGLRADAADPGRRPGR